MSTVKISSPSGLTLSSGLDLSMTGLTVNPMDNDLQIVSVNGTISLAET
jgi:hypothetical protein